MGVYVRWFATALLGIGSLVVSLVPYFSTWPRVAFAAIAIGILIYLWMSFPWGNNGTNTPRTASTRMTQTAGARSRQIQAQGDVHVEGGMGDER
ncbi:hypothetical protein [Nocardia rhamnosiphila]